MFSVFLWLGKHIVGSWHQLENYSINQYLRCHFCYHSWRLYICCWLVAKACSMTWCAWHWSGAYTQCYWRHTCCSWLLAIGAFCLGMGARMYHLPMQLLCTLTLCFGFRVTSTPKFVSSKSNKSAFTAAAHGFSAAEYTHVYTHIDAILLNSNLNACTSNLKHTNIDLQGAASRTH